MKAEVEVQRIGLEGQGVAYDAQGNIYFVPGLLPGDKATVEYEETTKKYRDATFDALLVPSAEREASPCEYFGECGGCDFLNWKYESQLKAKDAMVAHGVERAGWKANTTFPILPSPKIYGYRNRIQVRRSGGKLGFFKKKSHEIVDVQHCIIAEPKINEAFRLLRDQNNTSDKEKIELAVAHDGEVHEIRNREHAALGFCQVNAGQNKQLQELVANWVKGSSKTVLELFAGDGNLTYAYLPHVEKVIAIDSSEKAVETARKLKGEETKVAFLKDSVDPKLARRLPPEFRKKYDTLIIDPPRQGVQGGLDAFIHDNVNKIIYVSCSLLAFARDTQSLKHAFSLESIQPLDMFPHTRHVEFVALFSRSTS